MTRKTQSKEIVRWLFPVMITLLVIAILRQKSPTPFLFARYDWDLIVLFFLTLVWAGISWWIAFHSTLYTRLSSRVKGLSLAGPFLVGLGVIIILDFTSQLIGDLLLVFQQHLLLLLGICIFVLMLGMLILSSEYPRRMVGKLMLSLFSFCLTIIFLEFCMRFFLTDPIVPHTERSFNKIIASTWPRPILREKSSGRFRILGIADSFGIAGGKQNYHYLLENHLQELDPKFEMVNLSVGGYELSEEKDLFFRFGRKYRPDLVLHSIFVGNDFWGDPTVTQVKYRGIIMKKLHGLAAFQPGNFLLKKWLTNLFIVIRDKQKKKIMSLTGNAGGSFSHDEFLSVERKRLTICLTNISPQDEVWGSAVRLLDQIVAETVRMGSQYVMVIHPDQFQVETSLFKELMKTYKLFPKDFWLDQPQSFLRAYAASRKIKVIDLLPVFKSAASNGGLYLLDDTHYNDKGNHLVAETIFEALKSFEVK